ncbi:MAG: hypothetical protein PHY08_14340 [Candidatus Cloacimonetes bacterium]|nr:hypothetical protein [Candidatus Cloacimonadota bacterium]
MKHIAILRQPFFDMILNGSKTIESRFSFNKVVPYEKVNIGDEILLKQTGKDVTAKAIVKDVEYYELNPKIVEEIRLKYGKVIGTDKFEDWEITKAKKYCTLIWLTGVKRIEPIKVPKSHGAGWMCINKQQSITTNY